MGYTTDFFGKFKLDRRLSPEHEAYLRKFADTRHMDRDEAMLSLYSDDTREAAGLPIGPGGSYFTGDGRKQLLIEVEEDSSILDQNAPPKSQPGLWCQWTPGHDGSSIEWDGGEKFYHYIEWLKYIIDNFLVRWGYVLNGSVNWRGEDPSDKGEIIVENNKVKVKGCI